MKKMVLLNKKCLFLFAMLLFFSNSNAQVETHEFESNCKFYFGYMYNIEWVAHIVSSRQYTFTKVLEADKITNFNSGKVYTSSYGNYIEFKHVRQDSNWHWFDEKMTLDNKAIVMNGNCLYLVNLKSDKLLATLSTNFNIADDFQFFVYPQNGNLEIIIMNNGILSRYRPFANSESFVNSTKADEIEATTYTIDGKKAENPHNGVFLKGGKKVIIK